jgi:hypothetical protein
MSVDLNAYKNKLDVLQNAKANVENMVREIAEVSRKLENDWRRVTVVNIQEGNALPLHSFLRGTAPPPAINGLAWPTAAQIGQALTAYHTALKEAEDDYKALVAAGQSVTPPDP